MIERRSSRERDRATDRAASAARALATVAHDAAREYVKRDVVAPQPDGRDADMVARAFYRAPVTREYVTVPALDTAERERQARLRRWQTPPQSNWKGG